MPAAAAGEAREDQGSSRVLECISRRQRSNQEGWGARISQSNTRTHSTPRLASSARCARRVAHSYACLSLNLVPCPHSSRNIMFHMEGTPRTVGFGTSENLFGGYNPDFDRDRDDSRSDSITPPPPSSSHSDAPLASNLSVDQLGQIVDILATGIVTGHEIKRKDAAGKVYQNCFTGKEAINCLRHKLPKSHASASDCTMILQQMLQEGFLVLAQSIEELDRSIAEKFKSPPTSPPPPTSGSSTPVLKAQKSNVNPLALKLNLSAIGAAAPPPPLIPVFKKEGLYVLSHSGGGSAGSSANTSAANSLRSSPVMFGSGAPAPHERLTSLNLGPIAPASGSSASANAAGVTSPPMLLGGNATWFLNYAGFLGKKRENKGLGNSLALGLGVSTFQRRWFQVSIREQAVLYFKEDPHVRVGALGDDTKTGGGASKEVALPLGFIPFSEILLVDHIQSSTNQLAQQSNQGGSPLMGSAGGAGTSKKKKPSFSGSATPPLSSNPVALCTDEKTGRLFDIIASFRIYHLQADSTMDAMKWVQAIKLSIAEAANLKAERMLGNPVTMTLNTAASSGKTMQQGSATLGGGVKTPRTPEVNKRFWSNTSTPLLNASAFPSKYLSQVLKDSVDTGRNGILGAPHISPQRLSNLRKNFFELHFSISSLDQPSYFDSLSEEFPTDASIVEFCWNCITRGTGSGAETEKWGPKAFRAGIKGMGVGCTSAASSSSPGKVAVDISASTVLLARQREAEHLLDARMDDEFDAAMGEVSVSNSTALGRHESDADESHLSSLLPAFQQCLPRAPKHRRCISGSILPDFIGRAGEREASRSKEGHKREDSFNLSAMEARRVLNATRPFHRRFSSSVYPLPRSVADRSLTSEHVDDLLCGRRKSAFGLNPAVGSKFHDFQYMLLNRYALYHASALKALSTSEIVADAGADAMANPAFLYRIFAPYKRMEAWLATDCFLNLLLNDSALLNEVPLALPLIWLVLQWRNHDSDPHAHASSGSKDEQFIDDACLKKNWMDPSVDGEDDGFSGGVGEQGVASAEEAAAVRENKDEAVKAGFRSVARAHLRVTSFSTVADPFGALRAAANLASNSASNMASAGSPISPPQPLSASSAPPPMTPPPAQPQPHVHAPVVYGANGQIMMGMRGGASPQSSPMGHGHHHMSPHLMPLALGGTPQSPSTMYEYDAASGSPLPPFTPNPLSPPATGPVHVHLDHPLQPPPMTRAYSTPNQQGLSVQIGPVSAQSLPPTHGATPTKAYPLPKRLSGTGPSSAGAHSPHSGSPVPQARNSTSGNSSSDHSGAQGVASKDVTFDLAENVIGISGEHEHSVSSSGGEYDHEPGAARKSIDSYGSEGVPRGSASMPNTRRNSLNPSAAATAAASAASAAHQSKRSSDSGNSIYLTPRQLPRSAAAASSSASARTSPAPGMRQRGTIFQAGNATSRPPNLLSGAGGGYATLRPQATASSSSVSPAQPPPIPLGLPHWKVRSLIGCKFCFQSSVEFMQAISERYGIDGRAAEAARKKRSLERAAREAEEANAQGGGSGHKSPLTAVKVKGRMVLDPPLKQPGEFTIALSNTLFSLLLNPLYSLPSINACAKVGAGGGGNNPAASDSFNVLGKTITQPHIWPTIIACLQSTKSSEEKRKLTSSSSRKPGFIPGTGKLRAPSTSSFETLARAPFLKHHVLKDLNTLFIGSNVAVTNRNCALLFKFFDAVSKRERKVLQAQREEKEREKKLSEKEREKLERRRKKHPVSQRPMIGAWQQGLLELMRAHVPTPAAASGATPLSPTKGKSQLDLGIDRLHSKIYQYGLNLFGVFHFYRFQCIGNGAPLSAVTLAMQGKLKEVGSPSAAAREKAGSHTTSADFERLFRESFWRAMHMCDGQTSAGGNRSSSDSKRASPVGGASSSSSSSSSSKVSPKPDSTLSHTVARSLLTTMIQRLMFKIKSKTLIMDGRWPALAFLVQLVKSFVFSLPLKVAAGTTVATGSAALALATGTSGSGSGLLDPLLGFDQDFAAGHEGLHRSSPTLSGGVQLSAIQDDIDLLEKTLELLKALRLYQDLDVEHMPLQKQRDIKAHVEASAHASSTSATSRSGGRGGELHDPQSKLKLNAAHEDLSLLFQNLLPPDQIAFKFLQGHVSFTKDAICFLAMMNAHHRAEGMDEKELQQMVSHFVTMERREKVFCSK